MPQHVKKSPGIYRDNQNTFLCPDCGKFIKDVCPKKIKLLQRLHKKTCENKDNKDGPLYIQDQYEEDINGYTLVGCSRKI